MPKYFFNVRYLKPRQGDDDHGEELLDDEAAWIEATITAGERFKDIAGEFRPGQQWSLNVTDAKHEPLFTIEIAAKQFK